MIVATERKTGDFLLRLRKQDTPTGVSAGTIAALVDLTGLSKTEVAHLALRQLADKFIPRYDQDDGALTDDQIRSIRAASTATNIPEERFSERLF
jgi:hypothetical protein